MKLNNQLPCVFGVLILSCIIYKMFQCDKMLAIIIVSIFFILLYLYYDLFLSSMMMLFFLAFIVINNNFYNYTLHDNSLVRIKEINEYSCIGEVNRKKVILDINSEQLKSGDRILVTGKFVKEINIEEGIVGKIQVKDYQLLNKDYIYKAYRTREKLYYKISDKLGYRKAALISSVAFGYKDMLDEDDKELMSDMGISHVMAVSGLHMAIIYSVLSFVLGYKLALPILFFYTIFTGAAPSSVRAYLMLFTMNFGKVFNRNYNPLSALSLSGIIILILKPYECFSLGFMLSFLATLGIILFNKRLNRVLYKLPNFIRGVVATSLSAQVFIIPILIFYFNEMSLNFIIANLMVVPIINIIIVLGNILLLVMKYQSVYNFILYLCHYTINFMDSILECLSFIKINNIYLNCYIIYFYMAMIITCYFYKKGFKRFIYFPFVVAIYVCILVYNPIPTIKYYREGAISIGYKGQIVLIQTKDNIDKTKLKSISMANNIYNDFKLIKLSSGIIVKRQGKNFLMTIDDCEYLLKVSYGNVNTEYEVVDFIEGGINKIMVLGNEILIK